MSCTTFQKVGIPEFHDLYSICNCGDHVRSDRINKLMTIRVDAGGKNKEVNLSTIGGTLKKKFKIHELMMRTFYPGYNPEKHVIVHIDNVIGNNSLANLKFQDKDKTIITCDLAVVVVPDCPSLSELYQVCRCGEHVVSMKTGHVLSQYTMRDGYKEVRLLDKPNDISKLCSVHQLVAHAFLKHPNDGNVYVVDHINRNRQDNSLINLRFATYSQNNLNAPGSKTKKAIIQMDMEGNVVNEYESITAVVNKGFASAAICRCLKDDNASAHGFKWKYKNENDKNTKYLPIEGETFKDIENVRYYNSFAKEWEVLDFPNYSVSNLGNVVNKTRSYIVGFDDGTNMSSSLVNGKKRKMIKTHLLVAYMFSGVPSEDHYTVKFKDGNLKNCNVNNLEWVKFRDSCIESNGKGVISINIDGIEKVFKSISHASDSLTQEYAMDKISYSSGIRACLKGYQESAYGYKWKDV
jgi:hypothetical protein